MYIGFTFSHILICLEQSFAFFLVQHTQDNKVLSTLLAGDFFATHYREHRVHSVSLSWCFNDRW